MLLKFYEYRSDFTRRAECGNRVVHAVVFQPNQPWQLVGGKLAHSARDIVIEYKTQEFLLPVITTLQDSFAV